MEFDPIIDGLSDTSKLATWLVEHGARLDVSKCHGVAATELVVDEPSGRHQWHIPLLDAIDMVGLDDSWFATEGPADIRVTGMSGD